MVCFDCDELQFHYGEGCDACIDSLVNFVPKNCIACKSCELACKCDALIYRQKT